MRLLSEEEILERKQLADECIAEVHQCLHQGRLKEAETIAIQNPAFRFTFRSFEVLMLWYIGRKEEVHGLIESIIEEVQETAYATDYLESLGTLLEAMEDYEHWEKVLKIMEAHLVDNVGINIVLELQSRWLDFYKKSGNMKKYQESCIRFYELSTEKRLYDFKNTADMIDLKKEIRLAVRQKEYADKIIFQDPLTQIGNRSKLQQDIKTCIEEAVKKQSCITIGLIDVDNFKECNDTHGHIQGDTCLKNISAVPQEKTGELGMVYRYGGEDSGGIFGKKSFCYRFPGICNSISEGRKYPGKSDQSCGSGIVYC